MDDQIGVQAYSHRVQAANTLYGIRVGGPHLSKTRQESIGALGLPQI